MLTQSQCECFRTIAIKTAILQWFNMMQNKSIYIIKTTILAFTNRFKEFIPFLFIIVRTLMITIFAIGYPYPFKSFFVIFKGTFTPRNLFTANFPVVSPLVFKIFLPIFKWHIYSFGDGREIRPLCISK